MLKTSGPTDPGVNDLAGDPPDESSASSRCTLDCPVGAPPGDGDPAPGVPSPDASSGASSGTGSLSRSMACQVSGPTIPSTLRASQRWIRHTRAAVCAPYSPSAVNGRSVVAASAAWRVATARP